MKPSYLIDLSRRGRCCPGLLGATFLLLTMLVSPATMAAAIYADDLTGDEHVTTFEGFVGYDRFLIVANTGQTWQHDGALFSHTGTIGGVGLSSRIPLTGGTNTVMLTQQAGAGLLVEFEVPVGLAGATIFGDKTTATFYNQAGSVLGAVTSSSSIPRQFIGWSIEPGTGYIKRVLFDDYYPLNSYGLAIDNLVRGNPVPLPAPLALLATGLLALRLRARR
ncbi:MAG: hypothetical protein RLW61_20150 [Gammaproteobacteria bacterium]